jgi:cytochrome c oxidase subunit 4
MAAADAHAHAHADDGAVHAHISTARFYLGVFLALVFCTYVTVKVSYYDFGSWNAIIAVVIATIKASLVAAFFMHLRHDKLFNTLAFLAAFLFLSIFIFLTYDDVSRRGRLDPAYGGQVLPQTGEVAPGGEPATSATIDESREEAPRAGGESAGPGGPGGEKKE